MALDGQHTAWRKVVVDAARAATIQEAEERWGVGDHPANYRWAHVQAVVHLARRLAELTGADAEVVEAAAWLHDVAKQGKDDSHGLMGSVRAQEILRQTDFPPTKVASVSDAIAKHVGLWVDEPVTPLEAAVLWDADKLSKLGVWSELQFIGAYVLSRQGPLEALPEFVADQDWPERTVASLHTAPAKAAGRARLARSQVFWRCVREELAAEDLAQCDTIAMWP